jgi:hypothetical protein
MVTCLALVSFIGFHYFLFFVILRGFYFAIGNVVLSIYGANGMVALPMELI